MEPFQLEAAAGTEGHAVGLSSSPSPTPLSLSRLIPPSPTVRSKAMQAELFLLATARVEGE
jgi:hypothetical protein